MRANKTVLNRTFRQMLYSYLFVMLLPILAGWILYGYAISVIRQETDNYQNAIVSHMSANIESVLNNLQSSCLSILAANQVTSLMYADTIDTYQLEHMVSLQQVMLESTTTNQNIEDIYIYFYESDYLLSNSNTFQISTMEDYALQTGFPYELLEFIFNQKHYRNLYFTQDSCYFVFQYQLGKKPAVSLCIRFLPEVLLTQLSDFSSSTYLINNQQQILTDQPQLPEVDLVEAETGNYGNDYYFTKELSNCDLKLVSIIPLTQYYQRINFMFILLILYVTVCLLLGGFLSYAQARRQYSPIEKLMEMLRLNGSDYDAIQSIQNAVNALIRQNHSFESQIEKQETVVRSRMLENLIKGRSNNLEQLNLPTDQVLHIVELNIEDMSNLFFEKPRENQDEELALIFFMLNNIAGELYTHHLMIGEVDGSLIILEEADKLGEILETTQQILQIFKDNFGVILSAAVSLPHYADELSSAYGEINDLHSYREAHALSDPILTSDLLAAADSSESDEDRLVRLIREHQYQDCTELLNQLTHQNSEQPPENSNELYRQICMFVQEHYTDPNLSAGDIAERFSISQPYLSRYFKKMQGVGLLEYIQSVRIEHAKQLLSQGMTVTKTAECVGYYTTRPLIRAFKSIEGITPSEYKKNLVQNKP